MRLLIIFGIKLHVSKSHVLSIMLENHSSRQ